MPKGAEMAMKIHLRVDGGPRRLHVDCWIRDGILSFVDERMGLPVERPVRQLEANELSNLERIAARTHSAGPIIPHKGEMPEPMRTYLWISQAGVQRRFIIDRGDDADIAVFELADTVFAMRPR